MYDMDDCKKYDLHCHSCVSECSIQSPRDIVKTALSRGLNGLAVTDHNEISGALKAKEILNSEFRKEAKK
jgi:predicted metal-dependent phosphoesterase TrpH